MSLLRAFKPFPVDLWPDPVSGFITETSRAIGCDPVNVALPLLSALASAIGNTREIELKPGWKEPAIIWTVAIGESGTQKSPALEAALKPIRDLQDCELRRFGERQAYFRRRTHNFKREMKTWGSSPDGRLPREPKEPTARRFIISDTTVPALARLLRDNPRGILVGRDELAGWFQSFREGDAASWCEVFGARALTVDRGAGSERIIHASRASVSVTGSTQPGILSRMLTKELHESGLVARLLLAAPPARRVVWTESSPCMTSQEDMAALFNGLFALEPANKQKNVWEPAVLPLTKEGKETWIRFYNSFMKERVAVSGSLAAAYSKLEAYAARFALIVHCVRQVAGDPTLTGTDSIDERSVATGVAMSRWFAHETGRVYDLLEEGADESLQRQMIEEIRRLGGNVTVRDWHKKRNYTSSSEARASLKTLEDAKLGTLKRVATGFRGRPSEMFCLADG